MASNQIEELMDSVNEEVKEHKGEPPPSYDTIAQKNNFFPENEKDKQEPQKENASADDGLQKNNKKKSGEKARKSSNISYFRLVNIDTFQA